MGEIEKRAWGGNYEKLSGRGKKPEKKTKKTADIEKKHRQEKKKVIWGNKTMGTVGWETKH